MPVLSTAQWVGLLSEALGVIAVTMLLGVSPRLRKVPPVQFQYPRREGLVSLALGGGMVLLAILMYAQPATAQEVQRGGVAALYPALSLAVLAALLSGAALVYRRQPPRSAGWGRALLGPAVQIGIAVSLLTIFLRGMLMRLLGGVGAEQAQALLILLAVALGEETLFRGYLQPRFAGWLGSLPGWLLSTGLFVLYQAPRIVLLPAENQWTGWGIAVLHGLLSGWMMMKIRHVAAPALYRAISGWLLFLL